MRARCPRLPARIALAGLIAAFALPGAAITGVAATSPVTLSVKVGYQGVYKTQEWMPVGIDVKNSGSDLDGTVQLESVFTSQPGLPSPATYEIPLSLASGASKHLRSYAMVNPAAGLSLTVRVVQNGRVLASQTTTGGTNAGTLIGVLADDPSAFDDFAAVHPGGTTAHVVHLQAGDLADSAIVLRGFDLIAIDDYPTDTLTAGQRAALGDYVRHGGSLLLGTGAAWRKTLAGIPTELKPLQPTTTTTIAAVAALGGASNIEVATGATSGGTAWLSDGSRPLLIETQVGGGLVTEAGFDWSQQAVARSTELKPILRQVMMRDLMGGAAGQNVPLGIGGGGGGFAQPFGTSGTSISERSNALSSVLGDIPALDLPSLQLTGVLVLLYVLLVGPINYLVLGALHRRALSWVTIPLIAVLVAGGAYGLGVGLKGRSVQSNQVAIVHAVPGADRAYQEIYTGIMAPTRGDYQVTLTGEKLFISPLSANGNFGGSNAPTRINPASNAVTLQGVTAFSLRGFATESVTTAPKLTGHLQLVNGQLTGRVENQSSMTFDDALVLAGDTYVKLGRLAPGAGVSVQLPVKASNPFGGAPTYTRIYPNNAFGPGPSNPTAADREGQARTQVLSLLQPGLGFKGTTSTAIQPLVVAWTHRSLLDITVNGAQPRGTTETAVSLALPIEQVGSGSLPAGIVVGRIVDLTGEAQQAGPPGLFTLQNGGVSYEFTPTLAAGTHLRAASLNSSNPFGPKVIPAPAIGAPSVSSTPAGTGTSTAVVWDWSRSSWTAVAYQDNGTTALPDAAINPVSGAVRLRITGASTSVMTGGVSLTGSVQ
ncbi:MAG: hypothetical protein M3Z11_08865 [Candidatus Dormibacteraeota bacterium]|nr:hypothetical protein [Candidatus Dormibacteraeota bacterium]